LLYRKSSFADGTTEDRGQGFSFGALRKNGLLKFFDWRLIRFSRRSRALEKSSQPPDRAKKLKAA
jgi:hypothetical protein